MTIEEFAAEVCDELLGYAIDAAAKAMRDGDPHIPLHVVEAVAAETIRRWTKMLKAYEDGLYD